MKYLRPFIYSLLPALISLLPGVALAQTGLKASTVELVSNVGQSSFYVNNRAPLTQLHFIKLPVGSIEAGGWLKKAMELQRDGLTGNLGEISIWLSKTDNAWLNKDGKGTYGWEELPYWLKGYADIGYMLHDRKMIAGAMFWINAVLNNQRADGDFGPAVEKKGSRDLWTNMPMLWCLQSYYEYSKDIRVLPFMTRYFRYELGVPDNNFLQDYWENSRGGDNLTSVYWLYNRTGDKWLLELATKIDKATANWRQQNNLPNWHNVNIAQCFREPATYFQQSGVKADLDATYADFNLIRTLYGQVPGGMFGADENARKGYADPRQAVETCGMVEQMTSDEMLLGNTGDRFWAENCEDVAFNTFSAAFMPDYRSLRYLTAPNMVRSDDINHNPGIANTGPFLMMNPFSSRCCQHNHAAGWVYYAENSWMATPDNGLAVQLYSEGSVRFKAGGGKEVRISESTHYPFDTQVLFSITTAGSSSFPLYLRIPAWCKAATVKLNGKPVKVNTAGGTYIRLAARWKNGDKISLNLPMKLDIRTWEQNKNSISVNYGPLTYSLKITEDYVRKDSKATALDDSHWQASADPAKWPSYEILPGSDWNYGLVMDQQHPETSIRIIHRPWPADNNPFTNKNAPVELEVKGKQLPAWRVDKYGLCGLLPQSPAVSDQPLARLLLVPMGGARLRISAFPVIGQTP